MEPEVHIIEKYFQLILGCFTMTNIKLEGGKEIDLLALHPDGTRYHVESRIATSPGFILKSWDTFTKNGRAHRRGLDFFNEQKFEDPRILAKAREIFGGEKHRRILVVYRFKDSDVLKRARHYGIEIWLINELISDLMKKLPRGSRDDVLRTMDLVRLAGAGP